MRIFRQLGPVALVMLAAGILAAGCATSGVNKGDFNIISIEEEWQLGEKLERDLRGKLKLVEDAQAVDYLNSVGRRIVAQTEMRELPWRFHIVADPQINAFNIPGGHVYVNTGLIAAADDVAKFTGVLAHEITHGVSRHGTEQLSKSYGLNILAGLVLGENPAVYEKILAQIVAGGAFARFSRDDEREADRLGIDYMYRAGYDPDGMARMFEILLSRRQGRPGSVQQFFASHPLTEDRIREARKQAAALGGRGTNSDEGYTAMRRRLSGR